MVGHHHEQRQEQLRSYQAALFLNNMAVSMLQGGCLGQALDTFHDAMSLMRIIAHRHHHKKRDLGMQVAASDPQHNHERAHDRDAAAVPMAPNILQGNSGSSPAAATLTGQFSQGRPGWVEQILQRASQRYALAESTLFQPHRPAPASSGSISRSNSSGPNPLKVQALTLSDYFSGSFLPENGASEAPSPWITPILLDDQHDAFGYQGEDYDVTNPDDAGYTVDQEQDEEKEDRISVMCDVHSAIIVYNLALVYVALSRNETCFSQLPSPDGVGSLAGSSSSARQQQGEKQRAVAAKLLQLADSILNVHMRELCLYEDLPFTYFCSDDDLFYQAAYVNILVIHSQAQIAADYRPSMGSTDETDHRHQFRDDAHILQDRQAILWHVLQSTQTGSLLAYSHPKMGAAAAA